MVEGSILSSTSQLSSWIEDLNCPHLYLNGARLEYREEDGVEWGVYQCFTGDIDALVPAADHTDYFVVSCGDGLYFLLWIYLAHLQEYRIVINPNPVAWLLQLVTNSILQDFVQPEKAILFTP